MKEIITLMSTMILFYFIISFTVSNFIVLNWHWSARLIFVMLGFYTISKTINVKK